jgi:hypothetical protein
MPDGLRARVARVVAATDGTLELRLDDGVSVRYGTPTERGRKAHTLARILAWADARGEPVSRVTVVAPRMPTVVFGP